jgi:signal transduction histidine kinase
MVHAEAYAQYHGKLTDFEISRSIDPNLPEYVWLDAGKIKQGLLNLLTNAVKYTDRGQVQLSLDMQVEDSRTILHCAVRDSGRGISDKDRAVMFMEFGRAFEVREIEGTGLGLALSKKLIERHGGAMGFISELGRGSTFWFTVPLVVDSLQA